MNKTIDIHRIGMILRWDFFTNWKVYFNRTVGLGIGILLFQLMQLNSISGWIDRNGPIGNDNDYDNWKFLITNMQNTNIGILWTIFGLLFFISAANIFGNMRTKLQRESFLLLPANNLEKYLARFIMMSIGSICMMVVALILADFARFIFSLFMTPGYHDSITWIWLQSVFSTGPFRHFMFQEHPESILLAISLGFLTHSFATLGGAFYRKQPVILTACSAIFISIIFGCLTSKLYDLGVFDYMKNIDYSNTTTSVCIAIFWSIVFLALAAFNYIVSYKIFTRMQVICNKWINL